MIEKATSHKQQVFSVDHIYISIYTYINVWLRTNRLIESDQYWINRFFKQLQPEARKFFRSIVLLDIFRINLDLTQRPFHAIEKLKRTSKNSRIFPLNQFHQSTPMNHSKLTKLCIICLFLLENFTIFFFRYHVCRHVSWLLSTLILLCLCVCETKY